MWCVTNGELYHHGILGQKWGVRRFQNKDGSLTTDGKKKLSLKERLAARKAEKQHMKEVKIKAKNYQKSMNLLQDKENALLLKNWEYSDSKANADKMVSRLSKKKVVSQKKVDYWNNQSNILSQKLSAVNDAYVKNRSKVDSLLKQMQDDKDIVFTVKGTETYGGKQYIQYGKDMLKQYGKTRYSSDGGAHSVTGSKYIVKAGTDRNRKNKKFVDPKYKQERKHTYNSTYVYMY